jgi:putative DNA primase/helicase
VLAIRNKISPDAINADDNIINFKNCLYNIRERKTVPHNSNVLSTIQINANFIEGSDSNFENTLFFKFLNTSFNSELIPTIQEMIGYCFSNSTDAQKLFVLLGDGKNGKSVFIKILNSFFDERYISSVELKDLCKPEFAARLYGKAINTCADISSEHMGNTGLLKQIIGEDSFEARPLYSNPFRFQNRAKMVFSANELPSTSDKTFAFIRRLVILNCNKTISERDKIPDLDKRIIGAEVDAIAAWAIKGLHRLIENKKFSECKEIEDSLETYKLNNNSLATFLNTFCSLSNNDTHFIPKSEFSMIYKQFCETECTKPLGSKNINATMKSNNIYEKFHSLYKGRYWQGIGWTRMVHEFTENINGTILDDEKYLRIERRGIIND